MANFVVYDEDESRVLGVLQNVENNEVFLEKLGILIANEILNGATPMAIIESIWDSTVPLKEDGDHVPSSRLSFEDICTGGTIVADVWYLNPHGDYCVATLSISNTYIY